MVPIPIEKVHTRRVQLLKKVINLNRIGFGIYNCQESGVKELSITMLFQLPNPCDDLVKGPSVSFIYTLVIMYLFWPVNANGEGSLVVGAKIKNLFRNQHAISLYAYGKIRR